MTEGEFLVFVWDGDLWCGDGLDETNDVFIGASPATYAEITAAVERLKESTR